MQILASRIERAKDSLFALCVKWTSLPISYTVGGESILVAPDFCFFDVSRPGSCPRIS